jgi:Amt family ammonium transporter
MTMIGAAMLWVGWFGFNGGSALAADGNAGMAILVTHVSAAMGALVWAIIEWLKFGKPSLVGIVTGMVAGLATITPASGFVGPVGGLCIGLAGGVVCYYAVNLVKNKLNIDDSLDVFAVHGVGGILGTLMVAVFAAEIFGGAGLVDGMTMGSQLGVQALGVVATVAWTAIFSWLIFKITKAVCGLRVNDDQITEGLDLSEHGERAYTL